jgi:hypothetical protein
MTCGAVEPACQSDPDIAAYPKLLPATVVAEHAEQFALLLDGRALEDDLEHPGRADHISTAIIYPKEPLQTGPPNQKRSIRAGRATPDPPGR